MQTRIAVEAVTEGGVLKRRRHVMDPAPPSAAQSQSYHLTWDRRNCTKGGRADTCATAVMSNSRLREKSAIGETVSTCQVCGAEGKRGITAPVMHAGCAH